MTQFWYDRYYDDGNICTSQYCSNILTIYIYIYMHYDVHDTTYVVNWLSDDTDYTLEY